MFFRCGPTTSTMAQRLSEPGRQPGDACSTLYVCIPPAIRSLKVRQQCLKSIKAISRLCMGSPMAPQPLKCIWPGPGLRFPRPLHDPLAGPWQTRGSLPGHSQHPWQPSRTTCLAFFLLLACLRAVRSWWLCKRRLPPGGPGRMSQVKPVLVRA